MTVRFTLAPIALSCAVLSACGSGSSQAPETPVAASDLVVKGAAATGAAMPRAAIAIKCAVGTGSALTGGDGSYVVTIPGGQLPCALRATSEDGSLVLHSALEGSGGGSLTANVSPMSELIVAQAQGTRAALMFDQFESNRDKLTQSAIAEARNRVKEALASVVDLNGTDPIKDLLIPAVGDKPGNGLDQKLDALRDKLIDAGMKIQELGDVLTANADAAARHVVDSTIARRSFACKGVRSGTYRLILAGQTSSVSEFTLDAATMLVTSAGVTEQWTADTCTLSSPSGMKLVFGAQGIGAVRVSDKNYGVAMPKQDLSMGFLAGSWSWVRRGPESSASASGVTANLTVKGAGGGSSGGVVSVRVDPVFATPVIAPVVVPAVVPAMAVSWGETRYSAAGDTVAATVCDSTGCRAQSVADLKTRAKLTKAADGSFVAADGSRLYLYRAAGGATLMVRVAAAGGDAGDLTIARRGMAIGLPRTGTSYSMTDLSISSLGAVATDFVSETYTVKANDRAGKSFSRQRSSDCLADAWTIRQPFAQMLERAAGSSASCTDSSATALAVADVRALSAQGLGFSASVSASQRSLMLSVTTPKTAAEGKDDDNELED